MEPSPLEADTNLIMEHPALSPRIVIADLLSASPLTARALLNLRVNCIGCSMNKFCTLEELCCLYDLDIETVIDTLKEYLGASTKQ